MFDINYRLCRKLVESGFGDLEVKIGNKIISSIKSILINGNETLKKILLDVCFVGVLELYEGCDEIGYYEMEKYYSGGDMMINKDTVCEILMFCLCYNEKEILLECYEYIKNNIDDEILVGLIGICNEFCGCLKEMEELKNIELEKRGYKYLYNTEYLMRLEMNNVKELLSCKNVIIYNELWLLNRLMEWYKFNMGNNYSNTDNENIIEFKSEFKNLIEYNINEEKINENEMSNENKEISKELNIKLNNNNINNYIDLYKIKDENIQNMILNHYEEDNEEMELNEEEKEILDSIKEEELNEIIISLIEIKNDKMNEIVIMIIKYKYLNNQDINNEEKKKNLLNRLCVKYNEDKINGIIKCLSLLIENKRNISIIKDICGKEILYKILNEENYLNSKSKELLMEYIKEMKMNEKEEEEMLQLIRNEELIKRLKTKEITSFSYPHSKYWFGLNEEISIIPSFDGEKCEFSISPSLPDGLKINKENGIIHGKILKEMKKKEYEISCKNIRNEKKFKISLEFNIIKFTLNKSEGISISNNGKLITNTNDHISHCYINLKMESGIYHIKYQFHQNGSWHNSIMLGLSTNNTYSGFNIYNRSTTCNYYAYWGESKDITSYCHIGRVVNKNPNFNNHGDGSIYEIIVDMNKREFWISHNNSSPVLLVKDLPSPFYPQTSVELLSVTHQD